MIKHGVKTRRKPIIFTEYYLLHLAKAGICFTFRAHKVRIKHDCHALQICTQAGIFQARTGDYTLIKDFACC
ncbi:hypothetical protein D8M09_06770 [Enterobacter sp. R1(2018)]|nr:hypothetical protein D8M09_06770 [Enterobacter sp. R1(2018)]